MSGTEQRKPLTALEWLRVTHADTLSGRRIEEAVAAARAPYDRLTAGAALIAAERQRQIADEGWTPEHDVEHGAAELTAAALCYLSAALCVINPDDPRAAPTCYEPPVAPYWPWAPETFKATFDDPLRSLVKAGALIAAEIDRLQALGGSR